tara:strand:- start:342 stop:488 length:147 start_codon:yes stop_codon:yes gene_type:complete
MEDEYEVLSYLEWSNDYERKYNVMPAWWWNQYKREEAYEKYKRGECFD